MFFRTTAVRTFGAALVFAACGFAWSGAAYPGTGDEELLGHLKESRHTLVEGILAAEAQDGPAISAKLEFEDGKLNLSVYTAKDGLGVEAETNALIELNGEATNAAWAPGREVFADKEHVARAAMHLTLLQVGTVDLKAAIQKALAKVPGIVYSAIPTVVAGRPACVVKIARADADGDELESVEVVVPLRD